LDARPKVVHPLELVNLDVRPKVAPLLELVNLDVRPKVAPLLEPENLDVLRKDVESIMFCFNQISSFEVLMVLITEFIPLDF
jgi:hypothetical protein